MLQSMRDKAKSWVTIIVVAIIAFMMAITGLETLAPNPNNPNVASVNGQDITRAQLYQSLDQQRRMLMQQMGDQFDPSMIDEKVFTEAVLQSLIDRTLQLQDAEKNGMEIGQEAMDRMIVTMPEFQQDGRFDQARFQMLVRNFGMTPLQFKDMLREENLLIQLRSGFAASEFVTDAELKRLSSLENQTRDIAWLTLAAGPARDAITPTEEEITTYYNDHEDAFMTPEEIVVSYVALDKDKLAGSIEIDDEDINREYQARIEEQKADASDKQRVSSVLIEAGNKRTAEEARQRASEVLSKLEKGADFSKLAKEYSDDPATARKGGDMGVVASGFYGDEFDQAVASLEVGQISKIIETDFGLQILKLTTREQQKLPTLEQLRGDITNALKERAVEDLFLDKNRQLADISFEAADLVQPAEQLGLTIKTSDAFGRDGGQGIAANPKVVAAAFSDEVLNLRANSEVIEISPQLSVVLRVKEHHQPELIPLDDVKSSIVTSIKKEKAQEQLQAQASQLIADVKGGDAKKVAKEAGLSWTESKGVTRGQADVTRQVLAKAFKMPHPASDRTELASTELPNGDMAVISLSAVYPGEYTEADKTRMQTLGQYISTGNGRNLYSEYLQSLKAQGDVKIELKENQPQ